MGDLQRKLEAARIALRCLRWPEEAATMFLRAEQQNKTIDEALKLTAP